MLHTPSTPVHTLYMYIVLLCLLVCLILLASFFLSSLFSHLSLHTCTCIVSFPASQTIMVNERSTILVSRKCVKATCTCTVHAYMYMYTCIGQGSLARAKGQNSLHVYSLSPCTRLQFKKCSLVTLKSFCLHSCFP